MITILFVVEERGIYTKLSNGFLLVYILFCILLGIFAFFTSDWPSYKEIAENQYLSKGTIVTNVEPFWRWVAIAVKGNVYLFRAVIFVPCYVILFLYLKLFIHPRKWFLFVLLHLFVQFYTEIGLRQSLSIMIFYFAFMLFSRKNIFNRIMALLMFVGCVFLHKGTILFLPGLIMQIIKPSRKIMIISIIGAVIACIWFRFFFTAFVQSYFPEYAYMQWIAFGNETFGSRRIIYINILKIPLLTFFIFFLLKKSFVVNLNQTAMLNRNLLFYNYLFFCILYFSGFFMAHVGRFLYMMMFSVLLLSTEIFIGNNEKTIFLRRFLGIIIFYSNIIINVVISGILKIGHF